MPVGEEPRLVLTNSVQPGACLSSLTPQSFELLPGPSKEMLIDVLGEGVQLGAVEGSVVADPAACPRVDLLGEAGQVRPTATVEVPRPDLLTTAFFALALMAGAKLTK